MATKAVICGGLNLAQSLWSLYRGFQRAGCQCRHITTSHIVDGRKGFNDTVLGDLKDAAQSADILVWWQPQCDASPELLADLKQVRPDLPLVMQTIDDPQMWDHVDPVLLEGFDYAITCCEDSRSNYRAIGVEPIVGYPPCDADLHGKAAPTDVGVDITFVATNTYPRDRYPTVLADRVDMVNVARKVSSVKVFGWWGAFFLDWQRLGEDLKASVYGGFGDYTADLPGIYAGSRINLCSHHSPASRNPFNERFASCMASGGFLLCDRIGGIEDVFTDGWDLALWSSLGELQEKAQWWLSRESERREAVWRSKQKALELFDNAKLADRVLRKVGAR